MTPFLRLTALLALGLTAACAGNSRFDNADNEVILGANNGQLPGIADGSASDPTSPVYFSQTIGDRVFFAVDQSTLSAEAQAVLASQAQWLITNFDYQAIIEGHADEQGTTEYNIALSARRANEVRQFLVARGVPAARLRTLPLGKERPAELCSSESCYSKNRRAVTVISIGALS
ncbi:MAG: OmpA family protein [Pseudomonadota bacterium]